MPYHTGPHRTILYHTILYHTIYILYYTLQYYVVVCYTSTVYVLHYTPITLGNATGAAAWQGWVESKREEREGGAARKAAANEGGQLVAYENS